MRGPGLVTTVMVLGAATAAQARQSWLKQPEYQEVNPGEIAMLTCIITNKEGECRWEREGVPIGMFRDKYEWAGDLETGNCSLVILDASAEYDDGVWQCQVTASNFKLSDSLISDGAEVVVRAPPTSVTLARASAASAHSRSHAAASASGEATALVVAPRPLPRHPSVSSSPHSLLASVL